jgi:hypothetical protein
VTKQYEHINFSIPKSVQDAAKEGLELHTRYHRGGTDVGLNEAKMLAKGGKISPEEAHHVARYFPRHAARDKLGQVDPPSNGHIAWLLWGGDEGREWANKLVEKMNEADGNA